MNKQCKKLCILLVLAAMLSAGGCRDKGDPIPTPPVLDTDAIESVDVAVNTNDTAIISINNSNVSDLKGEPTKTEDGYSQIGDWVYQVVDSGKNVIVRKYLGTDTVISVPEKVEGVPVKEIESNFLSEDSPVISVKIPEGVTTVEDGAFKDCKNLVIVVFPKSLVSIGKSAFEGCTSMEEVVLSGSPALDFVGDKAFYGCTGLTRITFYNRLLEENSKPMGNIGLYCFGDCPNLEEVFLPREVSTIGKVIVGTSDAKNDGGITTFYVGEGSNAEKYMQDNNLLYEVY